MKEKKNNQKTHGLAKNPVARAFQTAWIWFKETAWIQVVLVVAIVFGVVFSIPPIVRIFTADPDTSGDNLNFLKDRRKKHDELNSIIKDNSKYKYTVVMYYTPTDSASLSVAEVLRKSVITSSYAPDFGNYLYTVDTSRTEKANVNDYDFTEDQLRTLAGNYKTFFDGNIWHKATYFDGQKTSPLYASSTEEKGWDAVGNSDGTLYVPANTFVIYQNGGDNSLEATPVWINIGFNQATTSLDSFLTEFKAAMNYATDPDLITTDK